MSFKTKAIHAVFRSRLFIQKYSPEILTVAGIAAGIGATITAGFASTHLDDINKQHDINMAKIAKSRDIVTRFPEEGLTYTENQEAADKQDVALMTARDYVVNYATPAILTMVSIGCILSAHNILHKRYTAVASALAVTTQKFMDYRQQIKDRYGEESDRDAYRDVTVDEKTNAKGKVVSTEKHQGETTLDTTQRFFDEFSEYWDRSNPDLNVAQLRAISKQANDKLQYQGHLFLNEVYSMLGMSHTPEGAVLGWIYDPDRPTGNFVDFGVFNGTDDPWDWTNDTTWDGRIGILLTFNVDGIIYDKI